MQIQAINSYKPMSATPLKAEAKGIQAQSFKSTPIQSTMGRDLVSFKGLPGGIRKVIPSAEDLAKTMKNQRNDIVVLENKIASAKRLGPFSGEEELISQWQKKAKAFTANYGLMRTRNTLQNLMNRCRNQSYIANSQNLKEALGVWERRTDKFLRDSIAGNKTFDESMEYIDNIALNVNEAFKTMADDGFKFKPDMRADRVDEIRDSLRVPEHLNDFVNGAKTFVNKYTR